MNAEVRDAVFELIWDKLRVPRDKIALHKSLNIDLGMDGDDAVEFFEEFGEKFAIDLKELGEEWHLDFGPEGVDFFGMGRGILTLFTAAPIPHGGRTIPMRIDRVVHAAQIRAWNKLANNEQAYHPVVEED